MALHRRSLSTATCAPSRKRAARSSVVALALLLATGVNACGAATRDAGTPDGRNAAAAVSQSTVVAAPLPSDDTTTSASGAPVYYIIVRSDEQAVAERLRMAEVNRQSVANGGPELQVVVIVVGSDEEAAQIWRAAAQVNVLRDVEGLAAITVLDRRSP